VDVASHRALSSVVALSAPPTRRLALGCFTTPATTPPPSPSCANFSSREVQKVFY
jgi:hypothetical protein